jgi:hypothetical protein
MSKDIVVICHVDKVLDGGKSGVFVSGGEDGGELGEDV